MTARPVAYIRKSTRGGEDSKADQIENVLGIIARNGRPADADTVQILDGDWGISAAREKQAKRLDFLRLMEMVESGQVSHLYAYSSDRLARNVGWSARLLDACKDAGISITTGERTFDPRDQMDRQMWHFSAMQNEGEVEKYQRKAIDRVKRQRERGVQLGQAPYGAKEGESVGAVLEAFREAGSYHGAVRLLIEREVPSRRGHLPNRRDGGGGMQGWSASTVSRIIARAAPTLVPTKTKRGARTLSTHPFSRLLICPHDGSFLTSMPRKDASTGYICRVGHRSPAGQHPRPWSIAESKIMPWAMAETAGILSHTQHVERPDGTLADIGALRAKLDRYAEMYGEGRVSRERFDALTAETEGEITRLEGAQRASLTFRLGLDWTLPPAEVNARLREMWAGLRLAYVPSAGPQNHVHTRDLDLVPAGAIWTIEPEGFDNVERVEGGWYVPGGQGWNAKG